MEHPIRTLPYSIKLADSFFKRLKGLMFQKDPLVEKGLWIIPCNSIHMCFMQFEIDAIFLNKEAQIVKIIEGLKPWSFVKQVRGAYSVLELPAGTISRFGIRQGDILKL